MPTVPHFQEELQQLKTRLLEMGGLAEDRVRAAVQHAERRRYVGRADARYVAPDQHRPPPAPLSSRSWTSIRIPTIGRPSSS